MRGLRGQYSLKEQDASQPTVEEFLRAAEEETKRGKKQKLRDSWSVGEREGGKYFGSWGTGTCRGGVLCCAGRSTGIRTDVLDPKVEERTNTLPHLHTPPHCAGCVWTLIN